MSKSYYGLSTTTIDVGNADNLTATGGGSSVVQTPGNQTFNFGGFMELQAHGGSTGVHGALGNPDGRGWLLDDSSLAGIVFPAGTWQALIKLATSDVNASGDLYVRVFKLNIAGASYTAIGTLTLAAQTVTSAGVAFTVSGSLAGVTFNAGESLYMDIWWDQTGGGSGSTLMSVAVASTSSGVPGASGGFELVTPFTAGVVNIQATSAIHLHESASMISVVRALQAIHLTSSAVLQVLLNAPTIPPVPLPLISLNAPAFANSNFYLPGNADDGNYGTQWRTVAAPSGGAPLWLAYDLSAVPVAQRGAILINILNEQGGQYLDAAGAFASSLPTNYTIDANAAPGGTLIPPATGWVNLVTVAGNVKTTVQHAVNFAGYNWLRFQATAALGTNPNNDVNIQMDVHDAHLGLMDRWLWLGDSITNEAMLHPQLGGGVWGFGGALSQLIAEQTAGKYYPAIIDGGNAAQTMTWARDNIAGLLGNFSGGFVYLAFGTNDCNQTFAFVQGDSHITTIYAALLTCIDAAAAQNNTVIVGVIPYGTNGQLGFNAGLMNAYIAAHLPTDRPAAIIGPDFWSFFQANTGLIRDGIHPTFAEVNGYASGYEAMHLIYAAWMYTRIYGYRPGGTATLADLNASGSVTLADFPGGRN